MFSWSWKKLWILLLAIPLLTACPPQPKLTLNVSQAARGASVTANLEGMDGTNAKVKVADIDAEVAGGTANSVTFIIPLTAPEGSQDVVITSGDRVARGKITITVVQGTFTLDRKKAARGESVNATTTEVDLASVKLVVTGQTVTITPTGENSFTFKVPGNALAGPQTVTLETNAGNLNQSLSILGDVVADKLTILLKPEITQEQLQAVLSRLGFTLDSELPDPFRVLGASDGPCASALADIDVNGTPLGQAIEELEREGIALHIDPRSGKSVGAVDHLSAISASIARSNGYTGTGSIIAVLDTGVNEHPELTGRLVSPFNAIDGGTDVTDAYNLDSDGHGTPIAVLAAGSTSGVAPAASIMPIKAFNENGEGFSNDVIVGVCHALTEAPDFSKLILNLSFGGDTPVDALEAILKYALDNGVQVAAAAGNEGEFGSPTHYPAAFNLPGLVAVGALQGEGLSCIDFEAQTLDSSYAVGSEFTDNNVVVGFKEFFEVAGQPITSGSAAIIDIDSGDDVNKALGFSQINGGSTFSEPLEGLSLFYLDTHPDNITTYENLEVNGERAIVTSFRELSPTLGGVTVEVNQQDAISVSVGTLHLRGAISQIAIGGEDLWVDLICPSKTSAWRPAVFSTRGDYVDISAPGADLRSGTPGGVYADDYEGTSFSTPLVAGAMALWKEADETLSPVQIEANLKRDALPLAFTPSEVGAGLLNLDAAPFNVPPISLRASGN